MDIGVIGNKFINLHIIDRLFAARSLFIANRLCICKPGPDSERLRLAISWPSRFGFSDRSGMDSRLIVFIIARPELVLRSLDAALAESRGSAGQPLSDEHRQLKGVGLRILDFIEATCSIRPPG
jgi:hypothetical protein